MRRAMKNKAYIGFALLMSCLGSVTSVQGETLFEASQYKSLVGDHRSYRVGQTLTVLILEQASAATSADSESNKSFSFSGAIEGNGPKNRNAGSIDLNNDFQGGGTVSRTGRLVASVSVTVKEILPSGEMRIEGEQLIHFNEEQQHIRVSGRVRTEDISPDNTVVSNRIADSTIDYIGDGLLGGHQKPGVITQFFNWLF